MIAPVHPNAVGWGYARVSTDRQFESTLGIRGYVAEILRYADAFGIDLGGPVEITVPDASGKPQRIEARERIVVDAASAYKKRLAERPGGRALCAVIRPGQRVIIPQLTRGFRNIRDCLDTVGRWKAIGVTTHILDSPVQGEAMLGFFASLAQWESETKSVRMTDAHREARLAGRPMKRDPDPGFTWRVNGRTREMVPCPKELALMETVVEMRNRDNMSEREIYFDLLRAGVRTPDWGHGRLEYSRHRIRGLLAAHARMKEIEEITGIPRGEADTEWVRAYFDADTARRAERERKSLERRQKKAFEQYQAEMGATN